MDAEGNISVYSGMDPDSLYYKYQDFSFTFFFLPSGKLYLKPYPTNHQEMLEDDDDLFEDVYSDYLSKNPLNSKIRRELSSRGQALTYGKAILGRFSIDKMTPLIAFWESPNYPLDKTSVGSFLSSWYKKFPNFKAYDRQTVLLFPKQKPITVYEFTGSATTPYVSKSIQKSEPINPPEEIKRSFSIGGDEYSIDQIRAMRSELHTKGVTNPVLCHPDIDKYPELKGYKPATCGKEFGKFRATHPQNWRQAGRELGLPYLYTPENTTFKSWFSLRESITLQSKENKV